MKQLTLSPLMATFLLWCNSDKTEVKQNRDQNSNLTPLEVVNKRMDFYNRHDFVESIKIYADDDKIYTHPDTLLGTGTDNIASIFKSKFA